MTQRDTGEPELRQLMQAGLAGDSDAHRTVLTLASVRLRAYFKSRLSQAGRRDVEAEDLVQEVLIAVHTRRHTYDPSQPFTPWLYGIARYKLADYFRRTRFSAHDVSLDDAEEAMGREDAGGVESSFDLEKMLAELPAKMQRAIRYTKLEGLSVNEAAERSGMSPSAVKVSVHRGLKALGRLAAKERQR